MKNILKTLLLLCTLSSLAQTPPMGDSTFYYNSAGNKVWFYYQRDIAFARFTAGATYTGGSQNGAITGVQHLPEFLDSLNLIEFDTNATDFQITAENLYLNSYPGFEYGYLAVTKDKYCSGGQNKWYMPTPRIIVIFRDAIISSSDLTAFMNRNRLTLFHQPDPLLPSGGNNWAYGFTLSQPDRFLPFEAAARIYTKESGYITHCEPEVRYFKPTELADDVDSGEGSEDSEDIPSEADCEESPEMLAAAAGSTPDELWHIRNNGQALMLNQLNSLPMTGQANADANICECWSDGYHGEGIKVAVLDFFGIDYTHPDMAGQLLTGTDATNGTHFSTTFYNGNSTLGPHAMEVASVIGAAANTGTNTKAVGVAYGSKIIPYIFTGTNLEAITGIQQAIIDDADVCYMNLVTQISNVTDVNSVVYPNIINGTTLGRAGKGIVFVAPTGNNNINGKFFPAMDNEVIGVGATDPTDRRAVPGQWFYNGSSNYYNLPNINQKYDVVAPGVQIMLASTTNANTAFPIQTNARRSNTQFAAAIVAGVAAIILSKYPNSGFQNVINMIDGNAQKVRVSDYGYNNMNVPGGYSEQMFFGRINCSAALANPTTGLKENNSIEEGIKLGYLTTNESILLFNKGTNDKGSLVKIYDISGRMIDSKIVDSNENTLILNTSKYSAGVYVINVQTNKNTQATFKYIK